MNVPARMSTMPFGQGPLDGVDAAALALLFAGTGVAFVALAAA